MPASCTDGGISRLRDGSRSTLEKDNGSTVSAGRWFTPHVESFYSPYSRGNAFVSPFSGVVASCPKTGTGCHPFPQVRVFTPQTQGIYPPLPATTPVATFRLPTGYHPEPGFRGVFPDVAAWFSTRWTWKHGLEKLELSSGSERAVLRYPTPCYSADMQPQVGSQFHATTRDGGQHRVPTEARLFLALSLRNLP